MKKLLLLVFLLPFTLFGQNPQLFTVQVGTFVNPQIADFNDLSPLGYMYAEPFGNEFAKVFLGEFSDKLAAENALASVREYGYTGFVTSRPLNPKNKIIVVQFTTLRPREVINWQQLDPVGKLYTLLTDPNRIKVVTGPFSNMPTARKRVAEIQQLGYKDAFIKTISRDLLHSVGDFEMNKDQTKRDLNAAVETILGADIPSSFDAPTANTIPQNELSSKGIPMPEIRPLIKRTSALDLQKNLKQRMYYAGSLDGFYGKGTDIGFENFEKNDLQYQKYVLLSQAFESKKNSQATGFQQVLNTLPYDSEVNILKLSNSRTPLAKAYRAYWLMTKQAPITQINHLMNAAIKGTFADKKIKNAPPFDFNATYSYEDLTQLLLHLRYLHTAPIHAEYALPCWLFDRHPEEVEAVFKTKSKFASFTNTKVESCNNFDDWQPIKIMNTLIADLQPDAFTSPQIERQQTIDAARTYLYLFPQKLNKNQKKETDKWLRSFWQQMDNNAKNNPVLGKNLASFKILFYHSQALLEDYFMNKEFTPDEAEGLALSVLKTYVEVPLEVYAN